MTRTLADTVAAKQLPALVSELAGTGDQVKITHAGVFAAMLVPAQKWRSIIETLDILADPDAVSDIEEADDDVAAGRGMDVEEVAALVARRRDAS
jgi:antitoxin YefM